MAPLGRNSRIPAFAKRDHRVGTGTSLALHQEFVGCVDRLLSYVATHIKSHMILSNQGSEVATECSQSAT